MKTNGLLSVYIDQNAALIHLCVFSEGVGRARRGRECALFLESERDETSSSSLPGADLLLCLERETCFFLGPGRRSRKPLSSGFSRACVG